MIQSISNEGMLRWSWLAEYCPGVFTTMEWIFCGYLWVSMTTEPSLRTECWWFRGERLCARGNGTLYYGETQCNVTVCFLVALLWGIIAAKGPLPHYWWVFLWQRRRPYNLFLRFSSGKFGSICASTATDSSHSTFLHVLQTCNVGVQRITKLTVRIVSRFLSGSDHFRINNNKKHTKAK